MFCKIKKNLLLEMATLTNDTVCTYVRTLEQHFPYFLTQENELIIEISNTSMTIGKNMTVGNGERESHIIMYTFSKNK